MVDMALEDAEEVDAIFLCAFWGPSSQVLKDNRALQPWLIDLHSRGTPIACVSNAPFFVAEAGLLDNKVATVYPPVAKTFERRYPNVDVRPERAITNAGDLYCANGIASGCDLIVSVIEMLYGPAIARQISKEFLLGFNRNYNLANVSFDGQKYHQDRQVLTAQQWLERDYSTVVTMESVAAKLLHDDSGGGL